MESREREREGGEDERKGKDTIDVMALSCILADRQREKEETRVRDCKRVGQGMPQQEEEEQESEEEEEEEWLQPRRSWTKRMDGAAVIQGR
jgi:hypothetical protein